MRRIVFGLVAVWCGMASWIHAAEGDGAADPLVISSCNLTAIDDVDLPATEPGMLMQVLVNEGDSVTEDQVVAQIDDREAKMNRTVAMHQYNAARKQAENEISVQAAIKSAEVAKAEWESSEQANQKSPGAFTPTELRRLKLNFEKFGLQSDLARFENLVASLDAKAKYSQYEQAGMMIERRKLTAPHSGVVVKVTKHKGDWVTAGEPVMRIVRLDKLRVTGSVSADDHHWKDVRGRACEVEIELPGQAAVPEGQRTKHTVRSTIGYASEVVELDNTFYISTDIENSKDARGWLLGPGLKATIRLQ